VPGPTGIHRCNDERHPTSAAIGRGPPPACRTMCQQVRPNESKVPRKAWPPTPDPVVHTEARGRSSERAGADHGVDMSSPITRHPRAANHARASSSGSQIEGTPGVPCGRNGWRQPHMIRGSLRRRISMIGAVHPLRRTGSRACLDLGTELERSRWVATPDGGVSASTYPTP